MLAPSLVLLALACAGVRAQTADALERQAKAAYLYKFAGFVEWPDGCFARPDSALVIGVQGGGALPAGPEAEGVRIDGADLILFKRIVDNGELLGTVYLCADYRLLARSLDYLAIALAVTLLALLAAERRIRMVFPTACALSVRADRTRLKQVLLNLLSNALKYNRELGAVVLDCHLCTPDMVRVAVQDTGLGLRPEQLELLFQPFNRLGQEAGPEEGTGIGLVVTKRLVELMHGRIGVSSKVGVGSVFWIDLLSDSPSVLAAPAIPGPGPAALPEPRAEPAAQADGPAPLTLLYVEDNPANLRLVQELVGFRPELRLLSAPDGHLGIELARAHLPQLILMDLNLPCISGADTMRLLAADPLTAHIPVIALTANAMPRDIERALAQGFFRYLTKPINIEQFTEAINSTLAHVAERQGQP